ncbi:MAG TPA: tetratricopeptide repeat protein [Anaerolineae bacterium]|nr:tetratricopeptide repeat protein [Anaerolineae bacterium]
MSKKKQASDAKTPRLSPSQTLSADTMPVEELALRRAQIEAETARRSRAQGLDLLSEGARLLTQNRPGEAAAKLEQAAALLPDDPDVAINLGGAYILQGRYTKAVTVLERAGQATPDNAMVWTNLAAAYLGNLDLSGPQQQSQAIAAYERALQIDATTPNVHYNLGLIYNDRQEWPRAMTCFVLALETDPNDADARRWLARLAQADQADSKAGADQATVDESHPEAQRPEQS